MGNPFDPLNVILFLIAVFGFIRLRMILGRRTGNEDPLSQNKYSGQVERDIEKYSQNTSKAKPKNKQDTLSYLERQLTGFNEKNFLEGASSAYEIILKNYALGNLKAIKSIISKDVFSGFNEAITDRINKKQKLIVVNARKPHEKYWKDFIPEGKYVLSPTTGGGYFFVSFCILD